MSHQQLLDALERYQEYEEYAQKLRHLIEEDDELEVIMHQSTLTALQAIEYAIAIRIHDINNQIEHIKNEPMDRFRRREVR
jgi:sulfite reductase alpha subunit-like flavoprotein